jgi:phosphoribosylaminoimidazolecarboxamide formyltransferase/IMP cyclohydrolase
MRALLSVYDKTGIVELGRGLVDLGWELLSSGGTAKELMKADVPVTEVAEYTGFPEMPDGLVKTLNPKIHAGLLAHADEQSHLDYLKVIGAELIDLVVVNLYPFTSDPSIKLIDIGGPTMIRAGAKNYARVTVMIDPTDYERVLGELQADGGTRLDTRRRLARKAFAHTAAYDAPIVEWFDEQIGDPGLPPTLHLALERTEEQLRYGENPHQEGARYRTISRPGWWDGVVQHQGLALSYLNFYDADAAWRLVNSMSDTFDMPIVAIIKHANPCGFAMNDDLATAYQRALDCDEMSAFGGIVAFSQAVDMAAAQRMADGPQADVVIAPDYEEGVLDVLLRKRKNTRVLTAPYPSEEFMQLRELSGGSWLGQDARRVLSFREQWRVVTKRQPTDAEMDDAEIAFYLGDWVKSNSIVLVKDGVAWGIGAGQQNRVESARIAATKAAGRAKGGAAGSDAFWPFPDGVDSVAPSEVAVLIQPGGAQHDEDVIARADELGLSMVFTGERHFYH